MDTIYLKNISSEWLKDFSSSRQEPPWLQALRLQAFARFAALPWPTKREEAWKRTNLELLNWADIRFDCSLPSTFDRREQLAPELQALADTDRGQDEEPAQMFWNLGHGVLANVSPTVKDKGVVWLPLEVAIKNNRLELQAAWETAVERAKDNKLELLALAVGSSGSFIHLQKGTKSSFPLSSYLSAGPDSGAHFPLHFILLEEEAEANIWEELVGPANGTLSSASTTFISSHTSITLNAGAQLNGYYIQYWGSDTIHFQFQDVIQGPDSRFNAVAVEVGGRLFRNETRIDLKGRGAENKVLGVLFGDESQHFENRILQHHDAIQTKSDIQYRGALKGSARSFFSGLITITKQAQQSDAYQGAKHLLLSKEARADAIPNLEILADDVQCSHGAAVGTIDDDQRFYLQSRGLPPEDAEKIIIEGFLEPVIARVPSESVQERLRRFTDNKINKY
ncbi:MAG: Fe-S cluster assembly protein SufD [Elusimicrobia bacterium]|nr:Fe-S cluster assembly protein SufD [Candidatus Obscuribacterium magneticum]